ncbi:GEVED domain-containing protein [Telluribacter sp. SYSU D00476]|uniref:GEVED domain-containing protein n=1 Tax=Telluribacter sp. SYSU D00476 TaxID=2811430 RepID=UPI001FF5FBEF|nr:GEVED domain-containing protein [Telluribacter sp. SYSU D00476]
MNKIKGCHGWSKNWMAIFMVLFFQSYYSTAQELRCGTPEPTGAEVARQKSSLTALNGARKGARTSGGTLYVPIRFHVLRQGDGAGGASLGELNLVLSDLNQHYLPGGIQYYMAGSTPDYIDSDIYYDLDITEEAALCATHDVPNAINLYLPGTITSEGSLITGYGYYPSTSAMSNRLFVRKDRALDHKTIAHELGHYFNLLHTFYGNASTAVENRELVTRGEGANCNLAGDLVCDTPADPYGLPGTSTTGCTYTGTATDARGEQFTPLLSNIMSYYYSCGNRFTPGQYARISDGVVLRLSPHNQYTLDYAPAPGEVVSNLIATYTEQGVRLGFTDNNSNESGYLIERATSPDGPFVALTGLAPDVTTYLDTQVDSHHTYYYRIRASNGLAYSATASVQVQKHYCRPSYTTACSPVFIADFLLRNASQTLISTLNSDCGQGGYSDYTSVASPVKVGERYTFTARAVAGGAGSYYKQHLTIWIDYNQNGTFDGAEMVFQSDESTMMLPTASASFTVPSTALPGTTRMRVRSQYHTYGPVSDPCGQLAFGEVEDYTLQIITTQLPTIATTSLSTNVVYPGESLEVAFETTGEFGEGNRFTVQLGGASEEEFFAIPTTGAGSPLTVKIPDELVGGTNNRVRVVASQPATMGTVSTQLLQLRQLPPAPLISADKTTICEGEKVVLSATGCEGTVTWSHGATGASVEVLPVTPSSYTATCTVEGRTGGAADSIRITVQPRVKATIGTDADIRLGESTKLTVRRTAGASPWGFTLSDGSVYDNLVDLVVTVPVTPAATTTYRLVQVQNMACGVGEGSGEATVIVSKSQVVDLQIRVLLEGPLRRNTNQMVTSLNQRGLLPGQVPVNPAAPPTLAGQPYSGSPWNYAGTESVDSYPADVVDWVLVSLRTSPSAKDLVHRMAALLHSDGHLSFPGTLPELYKGEAYYLVVEHRNHLGVLSHQAVPVQNGTIFYDFSQQDAYTATTPRSAGQKKIGTLFAMFSGDGNKGLPNQNFDLNVNDFSLWKLSNGIFDRYQQADYTLDAQVSVADKVLWSQNNGKFSMIGRQ